MSRPIWYDSTETGAPTLTNAPGSLLEVLRAYLVNGFNLKSVANIVVASGVATATAATHGYSAAYGKLLRIEGAPEAGLNGDVQPLTVDTNTFTYAVAGVPDGTYTGTITARRVPLGWIEEFNVSNVSIFARTDVEAFVHKLRVDDSGTASIARVRGVFSASSVDIFTGPWPTDAQVSGGGYWQKGANNTTPKNWFAVGTGRGFYFGSQLGTGDTYVVYWFGDGKPYYASDDGFCLLTSQTNISYNASVGWGLGRSLSPSSVPGANDTMYVSRGLLPAEVSPELVAVSGLGQGVRGGAGLQNAAIYEVVTIEPVSYVLTVNKVIRGEMPGLGGPVALAPFSSGELIDVGTSKYLAFKTAVLGVVGQLVFRLSGGWY